LPFLLYTETMNPYEVLGISQGASEADAKKAYKKLASKHHPDKGGDTAKFQEVKEAYERITEPEKFAHENMGHSPGGFRYQRGGSVDDIFSEFFGHHAGRQQRQSTVQLSLWITLQDVSTGGERTVKLQGNDGPQIVNITIPRGVLDNTHVRYPGLGPSGQDLVVIFRVRAHDRFVRIKSVDLACEQEVDLWTLLLGGTIEVTTLMNKTMTLRIQPKTDFNTQLRLKGQGIQNTRQIGDLYVKIKATMPANISDDLLEILRQELNK
jgi:curved DNA-binding protein